MTTIEQQPVVRQGWRTPAVFYRLISSRTLRAVFGWDLPSRDVRRWVIRQPGMTCVEIGSGGGFYTEVLKAHLSVDSTVVALDPAASSLAGLRARLAGEPGAGTCFLAGDGCGLPMADNSVDAMFYGYSLEEMPDPLAAVTEAHRVLKPGGQLVVFLWRPVITRIRRRPVAEVLDRLFEPEHTARGPQNIRLRYRKPTNV